MTTKSVKPVTRETSAFVRDKGFRAIVATIHHGLLEPRPKGLRSSETLDLAGLYEAERKGKRKNSSRRSQR